MKEVLVVISLIVLLIVSTLLSLDYLIVISALAVIIYSGYIGYHSPKMGHPGAIVVVVMLIGFIVIANITPTLAFISLLLWISGICYFAYSYQSVKTIPLHE